MTPCFDNIETVYVGAYDGCVYGHNLKTNRDYQYFFNYQQSTNGIRSTPLIHLNSIILATLRGYILSLNKVFFFMFLRFCF